MEENDFNSNLNKIAKSSWIVFLGILFAKIFTYIYQIIIARNFGPEIYGLFTLAVMIVGWLVCFSSLSLNLGILRYASIFLAKKKKEEIKSIFRFSFKINFITSILAGFILFFFADFISIGIFSKPELIPFLKVFSFVIPFTVLMELILSIFLAHEKFGWYAFVHKFLTGFLKVGLILLLIAFGFKTDSILFSYTLSFFGALIFAIFISRKIFPYLFEKGNKDKDTKSKLNLITYSWPLLFYSILWNLFHWTDSFALGYLGTASEVGIYNAAVPIAFLLTFASSIFMQIFFPIVNKEYSKGNLEEVRQLSKQVVKWILLINLPIFILFVIFPGELIKLLFGTNYIGAKSVLQILGIGTIFFSLSESSSRLIMMSGRSKVILVDIIIIFIFNFIFNFILIPKYGLVGAAISTMVSLVILSFIFWIQSARYFLIIPLRRKMILILLSAIFSSGILLFLRSLIKINLFSGILLSSLFFTLYIFLILIFKGFDKNDFFILKSFFRKKK